MSDVSDFEGLEQHFRWLLRRHNCRCLLLIVNIFLVSALIYFLIKSAEEGFTTPLALSGSAVVLSALAWLLFLPADETALRNKANYVSLAIWIIFAAHLFFLVELDPSLYIMVFGIFVNYTLLPFEWRRACAVCVVANLLYIALIMFRPGENGIRLNKWQNLLLLSASFLGINAVGVTYNVVRDHSIRRAILETKNCVESKIRIEHERQQQEKLLLSVIPMHLAEEMRKKMTKKFRKQPGLKRRKSAYGKFHEMYIRIHENVSILYADIVNFTPLASGITPAELVNLLNELFGRFDKLAQENECTRIKILGDCYYCVSGLPDSKPNHAINCVEMGLAMIRVINEVREATGSNVDMRIGVHTGVVLSGVIGLKKWQYDIWSDDATLANYLESSGTPGKIHISETTLRELKDSYKVHESGKGNADSYIQRKQIKTYLIDPKVVSCGKDEMCSNSSLDTTRNDRVLSARAADALKSISLFLAQCGMASKPFSSASDKNTADRLIGSSLSQMQKSMEILQKPYPCFISFSTTDIFGFLAMHLKFRQELDSWRQPDAYFAHSVTVLCSIYTFIVVVILLVVCIQSTAVVVAQCAVLITFLVILLFFLSVTACAIFMKEGRTCVISKRFTCFVKVKLKLVRRLVMFLILVAVLISVAILQTYACDKRDAWCPHNASNSSQQVTTCYMHGDFLAYLAICSLTTFLHISYLIKMTAAFVMSVVYICIVYGPREVCVSSVLLLVTLLPTAFAVFHQSEVIWKLGYAWKKKFRVEKDDVEMTGALNKILLENILPFHVADHFLNSPKGRTDELYHEAYEHICVMFASIPNFWEFYEQSAVTKHGIECMRILNEIICDFDQLLLKPKFSGMEKIKTIGSTFMAANGLLRGRFSKKMKVAQDGVNRQDQCVAVVVEFARAMFDVLASLNKNSFTHFRLRIGVNHGPAIAGVIGSQKPQYDIWGDTVNVASRMETTGVMDNIHCREETAKILERCGYSALCRGPIKVKGKAQPLITYLLK